jgi:hypothetical protein
MLVGSVFRKINSLQFKKIFLAFLFAVFPPMFRGQVQVLLNPDPGQALLNPDLIRVQVQAFLNPDLHNSGPDPGFAKSGSITE